MVQLGIKKRFNDDIEAQKASVEAARQKRIAERKAEMNNKILRRSICWYDAKSGQWCEVEYRYGDVTFSLHAEKPNLHVKPWIVTVESLKHGGDVRDSYYSDREKVKEKFPIENGFYGDGLPHYCWTGGGNPLFPLAPTGYSSLVFCKEKSKVECYAHLVTNAGALPKLFWEIYEVRVSIPMIQQAIRRYEEEALRD